MLGFFFVFFFEETQGGTLLNNEAREEKEKHIIFSILTVFKTGEDATQEAESLKKKCNRRERLQWELNGKCGWWAWRWPFEVRP